MERGEYAYNKLYRFVKDNLEYFEVSRHGRVKYWRPSDCEDVVCDAYYTMSNIAMYEDCNDDMKIEGEELIDAFRYVYLERFDIDSSYYLFDLCRSIQSIIGMAIANDLVESL